MSISKTGSATIVILDYKRSSNIKNHIIPFLLNESNIDLIVILHGVCSNIFGFHLNINERRWNNKILHIENSQENNKYICWRRWRAIRALCNEGIIKTEYILSFDDDILFYKTPNGIVNDMIDTLHRTNSLGVSNNSGGRIIDHIYVVYDWRNNGTTENSKQIIIGQTMFLKTNTILNAIDLAEVITNNKYVEYLYEDDIALCMCLVYTLFNNDWLKEFWNGKFSVCNKLKYKILEGFHNGISSHSDHMYKRTNAVRFWIDQLIKLKSNK